MPITEWELHRAAFGQTDIRIILCDDDPSLIGKMRTELDGVFSRLNRGADVAFFHSPSAIPQDQLAACDMAFLDIDFEREDLNGIDIARRLRQVNSRALIFFVTNFIDYAPEGYEVQAFRYILKRDLCQVLERYILQAMEHLAGEQEYLRLHQDEQIIDLPLERIAYIEVMDHNVSIHAGENTYSMVATLSSLEKEMELHGFLRIHKSYLVNMRCIRKFRSRECLLVDGTTLAVSKKNYSQQKQKYLLWKGLQ